MDQPHLIEGLDQVTRALGGLTAAWRFDRMATVVHPESGRVTASFAAVAKHYGVSVRPCPPRRGNRKGVVEKANHVAAQRFWRTLADDVTARAGPAAPGHVVRPARGRPAARDRGRQGHRRHHRRARAAAPGAAGAVPGHPVGRRARSPRRRWSSFRGNRYSVAPELARAAVIVHLPARRQRTSTSPPRPGP